MAGCVPLELHVLGRGSPRLRYAGRTGKLPCSASECHSEIGRIESVEPVLLYFFREPGGRRDLLSFPAIRYGLLNLYQLKLDLTLVFPTLADGADRGTMNPHSPNVVWIYFYNGTF